MSRRHKADKRVINPDPKFGDLVVSKFMNNLMYEGKKSVAEGIVYGAFEKVQAKVKSDPVQIFHQALENVAPAIEVRSRRVGGATYQVPVEVRTERRQALADPLDHHRGPQPQRNHYGGSSFRRAARCSKQSRHRREEARRHP